MSCEAVANVKTKKTPAVVVIRRRRQPASQEPVGRSASANMPLTAHSRLLSKNVQIRLIIIFNICNLLPSPLCCCCAVQRSLYSPLGFSFILLSVAPITFESKNKFVVFLETTKSFYVHIFFFFLLL
jgi:hypothetical protein